MTCPSLTTTRRPEGWSSTASTAAPIYCPTMRAKPLPCFRRRSTPSSMRQDAEQYLQALNDNVEHVERKLGRPVTEAEFDKALVEIPPTTPADFASGFEAAYPEDRTRTDDDRHELMGEVMEDDHAAREAEEAGGYDEAEEARSRPGQSTNKYLEEPRRRSPLRVVGSGNCHVASALLTFQASALPPAAPSPLLPRSTPSKNGYNCMTTKTPRSPPRRQPREQPDVIRQLHRCRQRAVEVPAGTAAPRARRQSPTAPAAQRSTRPGPMSSRTHPTAPGESVTVEQTVWLTSSGNSNVTVTPQAPGRGEPGVAKSVSESALTDALAAAIKALEGVQLTAGKADARVMDAEREPPRPRSRPRRIARPSSRPRRRFDGLEQQIIDDPRRTSPGMAAQLKAEKELLAERDREARDEIERLRLATEGSTEAGRDQMSAAARAAVISRSPPGRKIHPPKHLQDRTQGRNTDE